MNTYDAYKKKQGNEWLHWTNTQLHNDYRFKTDFSIKDFSKYFVQQEIWSFAMI